MNSIEDYLSVLVIDQSIDNKGIIANAGLVLGLTAGRMIPKNTFGYKVTDGDGLPHAYLTKIGHFVRKAGQSKIKALRAKFVQNEKVIVIDYTEDAAPADYEAYAKNLAQHKNNEIFYRALYLYGPKEVILPLTKNLSKLS